MSSRLAVPFLRRRSILQLLLSTGLGPGLTGCGGGSTDEQQGKSAAQTRRSFEVVFEEGLVIFTRGVFASV